MCGVCLGGHWGIPVAQYLPPGALAPLPSFPCLSFPHVKWAGFSCYWCSWHLCRATVTPSTGWVEGARPPPGPQPP